MHDHTVIATQTGTTGSAAHAFSVSLALALICSVNTACDGPLPDDALVIDRYQHDFGERHIGDAGQEVSFIVRNAWDESLTGLTTRVVPESSGFTVISNTCVGQLLPSFECTVAVEFQPTIAGPTQAVILVTSDRGETQTEISGVGTATVSFINHTNRELVLTPEPDDLQCDAMCTATYATPEVSMTVQELGWIYWLGDCESRSRACTLTLDGDKTVEMAGFDPALLWSGSPIGSANSSVDVDGNGDIVVSGYHLTKWSATGESIWTLPASYARDVAIAPTGWGASIEYMNVRVFDRDGQPLWNPILPASLMVQGVAIDNTGFLYIAGHLHYGIEGRNAWIGKYDATGETVWMREYELGNSSSLTSIALHGNTSVYAVGYEGVPDSETSVRITGHYVFKFDSDGEPVWTERAKGNAHLAVDSAGNVGVASRFNGYSLEKRSSQGELLWTFGDRDSGEVGSVAFASSGDVIVVGGSDSEQPWIASLRGTDGEVMRSEALPYKGRPGQVAVDNLGDVIVVGYPNDNVLQLLKFDGAFFDLP